ncbi:hypothetical protein RFI_24068, partial [Reticulomyxa filosa]
WVEQILATGRSELHLNAQGMSKLLLGINFYGYGYNNSKPTTGEGAMQTIIDDNAKADREQFIVTYEVLLKQFIDEAADKNDWQWLWNEDYKEHVLYNSKQQKKIWYPTLYSIAIKLALAKHFGVGVAIWELGQGLQYFNELL